MAVRTWQTGGVDENWGTVGNWLEAAVPTSADDVTFPAATQSCTLNTSARVCKSIDFTNYANTITFSQTLTVSGNITLGTGMTFAGSSALICNATATLVSNGKTCSVPLSLTAAATYTLSDAWTVSDLLTFGTGAAVINGQSFSASGGLSIVTGIITGTTTLTLTGGTWSGTAPGALRLSMTLAGNITVSGAVSLNTATLTYSSGTITTTGSTLGVSNGATTLNVNGVTWNNVAIAGAFTHLLMSDLQVGGLFTLGVVNDAPVINGSGGTRTITASGGLFHNQTTGNVTGSALLSLTGGTWTSNATTGALRLATTIAGNVIVSGTVKIGGSLTYASGTITTAGSTLVCQGAACTLNMAAGITWNSITFLSNVSHVLTAGTTVTMNGTLTITGTAAAPTSLISSVGSTSVFLTISRTTGKTIVNHCTATDIDSSLGLSVFDYKGTLTRTKNWVTRKVLPRPVAA